MKVCVSERFATVLMQRQSEVKSAEAEAEALQYNHKADVAVVVVAVGGTRTTDDE
jgi:hypothetical protein